MDVKGEKIKPWNIGDYVWHAIDAVFCSWIRESLEITNKVDQLKETIYRDIIGLPWLNPAESEIIGAVIRHCDIVYLLEEIRRDVGEIKGSHLDELLWKTNRLKTQVKKLEESIAGWRYTAAEMREMPHSVNLQFVQKKTDEILERTEGLDYKLLELVEHIGCFVEKVKLDLEAQDGKLS